MNGKLEEDLLFVGTAWMTHVCDVDHTNLRSKKVQLKGFFPVCGQLSGGGGRRNWSVFTFPTSVTEIRTKQNQRKIIRVDPDDAELRVVGVVSRYVLENLQKLVAVWKQQRRSVNAIQDAKDSRRRGWKKVQTRIFLLCKCNNVYSIQVVLLELNDFII